jgi:hypothetical protein
MRNATAYTATAIRIRAATTMPIVMSTRRLERVS